MSSITELLSSIEYPSIGGDAKDDPSGMTYLTPYFFSSLSLSSLILFINVCLVLGLIAVEFPTMTADNVFATPTFINQPDESYWIGWPASPGILSATLEIIFNFPPKLLIPVSFEPAAALFLLVAISILSSPTPVMA